MPAAILSCSLVLISCNEQIDNPSTPPEQSSAVDKGKWTIDESFVDYSVKPGDDFFMHRIGKWWANTAVNDNPESPQYAGFITDLDIQIKELTAHTSPSSEYLSGHLNYMLDEKYGPTMSEASLAYADKVYEDCNYEQACQDAVEKGDATPIWETMGRLMTKGAPLPFSFSPMANGGKVILFLYARDSSLPYIKTEAALPEKLRRDTEFAKALSPLVQEGANTRGLDAGKWPHLVAMVKAAGIDPADVYLWTERPSHYMIEPNTLKWIEDNTKHIKSLEDCTPAELANELAEYASDEMVIYSKEFYQKAVQDLSEKGINYDTKSIISFYSQNYMQYEVSHEVGVKFVTPEMRQAGTERCKELISVFADRIKANTWLSDEGKKAALEKLDNMIINVGCPEKWITEAIPDLSKSETAVEDVFLLRKAAFNFMKYVAGKPIKDVSFHILLEPDTRDPLTKLNAFYTLIFNSINIYPWWLMSPFYDPTQNQAINYASLIVTAHEITHGFDSKGYLYNKEGDGYSFLTNPADQAAFQQLSKRLVDRFNELDIMVIPGEKSRGEFCLAENIADLGGVEIAFDAYTRYLEKNGFKGDEMRKQQAYFFYAFTEFYRMKYGPNLTKLLLYGNEELGVAPDTHSLFRERINGIFRHVDAWYDLFGIKEGDKLYLAPADRVHIW